MGDTARPDDLSDSEKRAYRKLLYFAMLEIRNRCQSRGPASLNPLEWRRQYLRSRDAGRLADWLHNLADHSSVDFKGFKPEIFWNEFDSLRMDAATDLDYRSIFADCKERKG